MKAQSFLRAATVIIVVMVLHLDLSPDLKLFGVSAELPLACVVTAALTGGVRRGCLFGFACGLTLDMFIFTPVGMNALIYSAIGWICGHIYSEDVIRRTLFVTLITAAGSALAISLFILLARILGENTTRDISALRIITVASIINGLWGFILIRVGAWMWALDPLARRQRGL